jgi:pyruvate dehydrogenase E2 component (dihydrolipoamide acetyltransferase)
VPSPVSGRVVEINIKQGQVIKVGQTLIKVDTEARQGQEKAAPTKKPKSEDKKPAVEQKVVKSSPSEKIPKETESKGPSTEVEQVKLAEKEPVSTTAAAPASPSVRQLARELGIDINEVAGSGPDSRISADDVKKYAKSLIAGVSIAASAIQSKALPDFTKWGSIERKAMTATRRKIADILSYTWSNVPQVTQYDQADITILEQFRHQYSQKVEEAGGRLTITSILLKVVASALKEFPIFNASVDEEKEEIIYKKYFNIAVAVDTDGGLLVPVVRDVDKKRILQLSVELTQLAEKTRQHKVSLEEMTGGNFTISNLGGIGGTSFAPIIYWPQVAILGVARSRKQPVYINGGFEPRLILPLSLSYDHRVIDGAEALHFLRWIAENLEKPFLLAMQEVAG